MAKMSKIKELAFGSLDLNRRGDVARIEKNLFAENGDTFVALRFCKNRNGRHNRVHLVIPEQAFTQLFEDAAEKGVFAEETLNRLLHFLERRQRRHIESANDSDQDPFLKVIGIFKDGHLTQGIDEELYGDELS